MREFFLLLKLVRPQWPYLLAGLVLAIVTLLANAALLALAAWFITSMALAGVAGIAFNYHHPAAAIRSLAIVRSLGRYAERYLSHLATFRLLSSLRLSFFTRLEPLAPAGLSGIHSGDIFSRLKADIDMLDEFYLRFLLPLLAAFVTLSLLFLFIFSYSPALAFYMSGLWLFAGLLLPLVLLKLAFAMGDSQLSSFSRLRSDTIDLVRAALELRLWGESSHAVERLMAENKRQSDIQRRLARVEAVGDALMSLFPGLALLGLILILVPLWQQEQIAAASLPMLAVLVLVSFEGVQQMPIAFKAWGRIRAAAIRVFNIIDKGEAELAAFAQKGRKPSSSPPPPKVATTPATPSGTTAKKEFKSTQTGTDFKSVPVPLSPEIPFQQQWNILFEQIRFRYPGSESFVFDNFNLSIAAGERLAICGASGAGKSSLVNLLLCFYKLDSGRIFIAGKDISLINPESVRSWLGVVSQQTVLFNASIKENLLLASPKADDQTLYRALADARLDSFVRKLPEGLDSPVGQAGIKLSGGQARRLAIARAVLKKTPVLILDEPGEGLDYKTEKSLWETLLPLMQGKTVILITHHSLGIEYMHSRVDL